MFLKMNIKDIAQMAGVSRATVSRYLNNGYVSDEKRAQIKEVIEKTGYIPSTQAQMLRTKKSKLIGVIVPKISSETIAKIVDGICSVLAEYDYHVFLANTDNDSAKELEYLNIFKNNHVDGVVLVATVLSKRHHAMIQKMPVPVVIVGQEYEAGSCVFHDDFHAAKAITEKLLEYKGSYLAYFGVTPDDLAVGVRRRDGFFAAVEEAGLDAASVYTAECKFTIESGFEQMSAALDKGVKIKGAVCATDNIALGVIQALQRRGLHVPGDVSVTGFGDSRLASLVTPPITTVRYYYRNSGEEAGRMIMSMIQDEVYYTKKLMLGYELVFRNTL